jgi:hypothetical protein
MNKIDIAEAEINEVLKRHNLKYGYKFSFPVYKILPSAVQLALDVLETHGLKVSIILKEKKNEK